MRLMRVCDGAKHPHQQAVDLHAEAAPKLHGPADDGGANRERHDGLKPPRGEVRDELGGADAQGCGQDMKGVATVVGGAQARDAHVDGLEARR